MAELELEVKSPGSRPLRVSVLTEIRLFLACGAYPGAALLVFLDAGAGRQCSLPVSRDLFGSVRAPTELDKRHYEKRGGVVGKRYYAIHFESEKTVVSEREVPAYSTS